ncbi:MAG: alkaline phosphatase family protein, partial [Chloroflexi bacterium]|nr:alkaline phosphatase family protein [Chloroflexota bacterium]
ADHSYDQMSIATARAVQDDRVWNVLDKAGKRSIIVGVPQTYPPSPLNGEMVTSFLTPSIQSQYTYPPELRDEIASVVGEYMLDVPNFRTDDKDWLLRKIQEMSEKQFRLVRHMLRTRTWDFFMMVGMGPDRIHHGFWQYMDPAHPKYEPGSPYKDAIKEFYLYLDREIGELLSLLGDDVAVLVVSDHGAQAMEGGICINEWLMQEGYLTLKQPPNKVVPLSKVEIDWSRTKSWGAGGYYGRLFLNVQGREPQGVIPAADYEKVRDEIIAKLEAITDPAGRNIGTRAFKPEDVYREVNNIPPDLIVYFGNLAWRSVGSVGLGAVHTFENDTGPDDANHAQNGLFIVCDGHSGPGQREHRHIQSIASTILKLMGVPVPEDMVYPPA